jgi:hypothetical protein
MGDSGADFVSEARPARLGWPAAVLGVIGFAMPAASSSEEPRASGAGGIEAEPAASTRCAADVGFCDRLCAPERLVFLPCMAVGAPNMPACRQREVRSCRSACAARRTTC